MFNLLGLGSIWGKISAKFKFEKNVITIINNNMTIVAQKYDKNFLEKIYSENLKKLESSVQNIPKENLIPLEPYKSDTAIQKLHHVTEDNIAEMFIELLTKSADSRYSNKVHARYQTILSSLDPDDAKLLKFIFKTGYPVNIKPEDAIKTGFIKGAFDTDFLESIKKIPPTELRIPFGIPFLEIRKSEKDSSGFNTLHKIFTDINKLPTNKNIEDTESQMEHLVSLGLIEIKSNLYLHVTLYDHLENSAYVTELIENANKRNEDIQKIKGRIDLTTLGKNFLSIVLKDKKKETENVFSKMNMNF